MNVIAKYVNRFKHILFLSYTEWFIKSIMLHAKLYYPSGVNKISFPF